MAAVFKCVMSQASSPICPLRTFPDLSLGKPATAETRWGLNLPAASLLAATTLFFDDELDTEQLLYSPFTIVRDSRRPYIPRLFMIKPILVELIISWSHSQLTNSVWKWKHWERIPMSQLTAANRGKHWHDGSTSTYSHWCFIPLLNLISALFQSDRWNKRKEMWS